MITDNMKAWGIIYANTFQKLRQDGYSEIASMAVASSEADEFYPLEECEAEEVKRMAQEGRLNELARRDTEKSNI